MEITKNKSKKIITFKKKINCPSCKKKSVDPFTPFCSKKCCDFDLIKWLSDESSINLIS